MGELLDQEHPDALRGDSLERRHEALDDHRCETERELVDEDDLRLRDESLGEHHHLLLAAREQARRVLPALLELREELECVGDAFLRVRPC